MRIEFSINLTISTNLTFMFRKRCKFTQSSCVISAFRSGLTLLEILAPRHPRTSKKQGNGEADGGSEVFDQGKSGREYSE